MFTSYKVKQNSHIIGLRIHSTTRFRGGTSVDSNDATKSGYNASFSESSFTYVSESVCIYTADAIVSLCG